MKTNPRLQEKVTGFWTSLAAVTITLVWPCFSRTDLGASQTIVGELALPYRVPPSLAWAPSPEEACNGTFLVPVERSS
jgi:hypothetical protein